MQCHVIKGFFLCVQAPFPGKGEGRRKMAHTNVWLYGLRFGTRITTRDSSLDQKITEMLKSIKSRGEEAFAIYRRQQEKKARKEKEKARQERANVARLRWLRLAKEAADKEAAKNKKPSQLPNTSDDGEDCD